MDGFKAIYSATSLAAIATELRRRADALVEKSATIRSAGTKRETIERAVGLREAAALLDDTVLRPDMPTPVNMTSTPDAAGA